MSRTSLPLIRRVAIGAAVVLAAAGLGVGAKAGASSTVTPATVRVSGNRLVNAAGQPLQPVGINQMTGGCWRPAPNGSIIYGPADSAMLGVLGRWHVNTVRITTNEDCWLGINGAPDATSGAAYRNTITSWVQRLTAHGDDVIISLAASAPGNYLAQTGQAMADADHAPSYWRSVATTFKSNPGVIFEPYNEPDITSDTAATTDPWQCWLSGCTALTYRPQEHKPPVALRWQTVGMQQLVNLIRSTGARNVITLSGLHYANDLSGLLAHLPHDPIGQLTGTFHNYGQSAEQNEGCGPTCWNTVIAPLAQHVPVITDELGQPYCDTSYVTAYMTWADAHDLGYLPWGWTTWGCGNHGYGLLADWNGTPNSYGAVFYQHFNERNP